MDGGSWVCGVTRNYQTFTLIIFLILYVFWDIINSIFNLQLWMYFFAFWTYFPASKYITLLYEYISLLCEYISISEVDISQIWCRLCGDCDVRENLFDIYCQAFLTRWVEIFSVKYLDSDLDNDLWGGFAKVNLTLLWLIPVVLWIYGPPPPDTAKILTD